MSAAHLLQEPLAVVGIGARFPGASNTAQFWRLLRDGADVITEVPHTRFDIDSLHDPNPGTPGRLSSRWGGFIEDVDLFDAAFFGISPREATRMDPQQRLALEVAWDALDDGGQVPLRLRGTPTGVFLGVHRDEYGHLGHRDPRDMDLLAAAGGSRSGVAARISYALGLEGPSLVFDTDRSSSLVAVHAACRSLRSGECSLALAGGVNLILTPELSLGFSRANMLAPDGRIKFCDARADGIVRSDGVGIVALKRLSAAQRNGDPIYAVVLGSATNHDGGRSGDLMTPSSASQSALILDACQDAGVSPLDIQYVEAHGTGTIVGDPIEVQALAAVLQRGRSAGSSLRIGSVKTNIGHAEAAAGIAGFIKVALAMKHRLLPASLHFESPNPRIVFEGIIVQRQTTPWPDESRPLLAGVTSLGLTGANAHVILAEAPRPTAEQTRSAERPIPDRAEILPVSARGRDALVALGRDYVRHLRNDSGSTSDFARAAATRRSHLEDRLAVVGRSREEIANELEALLDAGDTRAARVTFGHRPKVAFVFPGHDFQWSGIGSELFASESAFRASIVACDAALQKIVGWSLLEELARDGTTFRRRDLGIVQPALVALGISLAAQWRAWGVEPDVTVGTGIGEVAAAQVAGVLSIADAMLIVGTGARLAQEKVPGAASIVEIHPHVDSIAAALASALTNVKPTRARVPMMSTVTGGEIHGQELDGSYWVRNLRERFDPSAVVVQLLHTGCELFLELSPHPVLLAPIADLAARGERKVLAIGSLRRNEPERGTLLRALASLYASGFEVEWQRVVAADGAFVELPPYAWQRQRFWFDEIGQAAATATSADAPSRDDRGSGIGQLESAVPRTGWAGHLGGATPREGRERARQYVKLELATVLGISDADSIDTRRSFRELGVTSLMATEFMTSLGKAALDRALPSPVFFNHPNVDALAEYLVAEGERQAVRSSGEPTVALDFPTPSAISGLLLERAFTSQELRHRSETNAARSSDASAAASGERASAAASTESVRERASHDAPADGSIPQRDEPIAIVGFGCRFPGGVVDGESFWRLLADGVDAIREVPKDRWDVDAYYDPDPSAAGKMYTREGGFLEGLDRFDAEFFEISPREAENMDPQQRLLLETSWEALERAGIAPSSLFGKQVGVFVGVMSHEYMELQGTDLVRRDGYVTTGSLGSVASGRISYALGIRGPSMTIDTACSSSLVATHVACQSLRSGECDLALAGGATVVLTPSLYTEFCRLRALSRDGRCKSFDAAADGVIWSEGCGVLALKRLSDARRDGDRVLALIVGSAVNQDGRSQGLTAPNGVAQQEVIERALSQAKVAPAAVDYVEAHGTGTRLGDPIEMLALGAVLRRGRDTKSPVVVGSLKSNIGHTQAAAGVGGIIKTVLALEHEMIPRSLHFREPSPHIPWSELPVRMASEPLAWKATPGRPRIAGVSSFGISGTNAHVVLQDAPSEPIERPPRARAAEVLVVSAKSASALMQATRALCAHVRAHSELGLEDIAATLARGRAHHPHRLAVVARSREDATLALEAAAEGQTHRALHRDVARGSPDKIAWLFTGQGAQWAGMGRGLAAGWPAFRQELERISGAFDAHLDRPLQKVMWEDATGLLDQTGYTQPALFALEAALAALWRSWGVAPDVLMGHSIGELTAAYVAGVFHLEDAARLVAARARLMQALPTGGTMLSVGAPEAWVEEAVSPHAGEVSIAAVNGPESVVISGAAPIVEELAARFAEKGVRTGRLSVSHAFHSPLMDPMLEDFGRVAATIRYRAPSCLLVSNVSGAIAGDEVATAGYWVDHVRRAVRFSAGVRAARDAGARVFLELGPKPTLVGLVRACAPRGELAPVLVASMRADRSEAETILEALGSIHVRGGPVDWAGVFAAHGRAASLPTYPWQRKRYWVDDRADGSDPGALLAPGMTAVKHPVLRGSLARPDGEGNLFTARVSLAQAPWLSDHRVFDTTLLPGTAFMELALAVGRELGMTELTDLTLSAPLLLITNEVSALQIWVEGPDAHGRCALALYSRAANAAWTCHARGRLGRAASASPSSHADWPPKGAKAIDLSGLYDTLAVRGLAYGPAFQGIAALWRDDSDLYALVELPEQLRHEAQGYILHPALLDAALHVLPFLLPVYDSVLLPFEWRDVAVSAVGATRLWVRLELKEHGDELSRVALDARDGAGQRVLRIGELVLRRAIPERIRATADRSVAHLHRVLWEPLYAVEGEPLPSVVLGGSGALAQRLELPRLTDLGELGQEPTRVFVDATMSSDGDLATQAHATAYRGLEVLQAWLMGERPAGSELVWVTQSAVAATDDDAVRGPALAVLWGLARSARRENPHRGLRVLDIDAASSSAEIQAAVAVRGEPELAIRAGTILAPRLVPAVPASTKKTWRTDGTVLVTGATGNLGTLVARHLVERHGVRHLLLTSRQGAEAPGARALREELERKGAHVTLTACDVSRGAAMGRLLDGVSPPLSAVFHCAGVVDDVAVSGLSPERIDRVFGPKVDAAVHLHELTRALPLEHFVLFSSVSGILGTAGQANYAAANAFLDALAAHRAQEGLPAQSLAWGLWEPSGTGMTAKLTEADLDRIRRQGILPLSAEQGLELFDEAIGRGEALWVPVRLDRSAIELGAPQPILQKLVKPPPLRTASAERPRAQDAVALTQRLARLAPAERRSALLELVRGEVGGVFHLPSQIVPDDTPLKSLGLDSLMAVELRDRLGTKLMATLPATLAFDHPTAREVARFLETVLPSNGGAGGAASDEEAAVRRALATLPLDVLRRQGLLNRLLELANGDTTRPPEAASAIDELSNEELVTLVKSL